MFRCDRNFCLLNADYSVSTILIQ